MDYQAVQIAAAKVANYVDIAEEGVIWSLIDRYRAYSMTSLERLYDLCKSIEYIHRAGIPGSIVECGVWQGGSMMLAAAMLAMLGDYDRTLLLCDTFEGHPKPDEALDTNIFGENGAKEWKPGWGAVDLDTVQTNMRRVRGADRFKTLFVVGKVEDTLPPIVSENWRAAIVRLDTDWYRSTQVELEVLWPKLSPGGILIIDDYGCQNGVRKAVDEYFADKPVKLNRIDYSCRTIIKGY